MMSIATHTPNNVASIDARDPQAGGAAHFYGIQLPDRSVVKIQFQHGPRGNPDSSLGIMDDDLLAILEDRMTAFQSGPFSCAENGLALSHIQSARDALARRVADRISRGVLGVNEK
jgi:hypothetical protein